jgi:dipeptidyl aminopeptidase/acylaminoacyl peptidase
MKKIIILIVVAILVIFVFFILPIILWPSGIMGWHKILNASSLDGNETIFYIKDVRSLFSIKSNGTDKKELLKNVIMYQLSPDGKKLMAESNGQDGIKTLTLLDLVSYKSSAVDFAYDFSSFQWSPDGKKIAYVKVFDEGNVFTKKLIIHDFSNSQDIQSKLDSTFDNIKWLNDGTNILVYTNSCNLSNKYLKYCYGIYNLNYNNYSQFTRDRLYKNSELIRQIHFNQSYSEYLLQSPSESVSFDRKYKLENKDNNLYLVALADDESNWNGLCKYDNVPENALKREGDKNVLVYTRGCVNYGCQPNFTGFSWFADNRFANVVYSEGLYIVDVKSKNLYYLDNGLGPRDIPMTYVPNYKPALPVCALDKP